MLTRWILDDSGCNPDCNECQASMEPARPHEDPDRNQYIHSDDIPHSILACLDDPDKSEELEQVAGILAGKLEWHDAELNLIREWFDAVQDLNPKILNQADHALAKFIYERLGWRVPNSINEGIAAQAKEKKL